MRFYFNSLIVAIVPIAIHGFVFQNAVEIKEGLVEKVNSQETKTIGINMDIGAMNSQSRLNVNDLIFELASTPATYKHPMMPGVDGPNPQLSGGARTLNIINEGWFIDMSGKKSVKTLNGCWEMVWKENSIAGSLVCGFDIPEEYKRNQATLPKCRLYMNFPLWTKAGLEDALQKKKVMLSRARKFNAEKEMEMEKMQTAQNPIVRALHYRNAASAKDMWRRQNVKQFDTVPSFDEVIQLQDDLLLTTKGMAFSREGTFKRGKHFLLGKVQATLQ